MYLNSKGHAYDATCGIAPITVPQIPWDSDSCTLLFFHSRTFPEQSKCLSSMMIKVSFSVFETMQRLYIIRVLLRSWPANRNFSTQPVLSIRH